MEEVQQAVLSAKRLYDTRSKHADAKRWLRKFSKGIMYYAVILDTLSQHHPEYVSLAWGAMKFIFIGVINHEQLVVELSKALCSMADALPSAQLKNVLYPTEQMKQAVAVLYSHILEILQRAAEWYRGGKIKHLLGSIARPWSLHFSDLVEDLSIAAKKVDELAIGASMAEQRDMHLEQQELRLEQRKTHALLEELKRITEEYQKLSLVAHLNTNQRVCDMQFSQIMTFMATSTECLPSPEVSRKQYQARRNSRQFKKGYGSLKNPVCTRTLQSWADTKHSSTINVCGSFVTRHEAQDFAVDAIDFIAQSQAPLVWILNIHEGRANSDIMLSDVLKALILQILKMNHTMLTERSLSLSAARFQSATTDAEWIALLGTVLEGLPYVYMIIDTEVVGNQYAKWSETFNMLFDELRSRNIGNIIKVALVWYRQKPADLAGVDKTIKIRASAPSGRRPMAVSNWRSRKGPQARLRGLKLSH
ncbi:uncharacterized protein LY89DRAFT_671120 [Mollisia scopiformis]|uniref:DUF7708 domain-containing protein n=1 Tax=Mollisia scopiformis TaxID=149040 RepID=A0A194X3F1_MOLSC|nr:uncharacterized protein LY89DRAFT_671120 [Mollisia scopiformis]KUJ14696.1 hypothetical protein LY89DRAFT_671120 [Mollisia scopiformis]